MISAVKRKTVRIATELKKEINAKFVKVLENEFVSIMFGLRANYLAFHYFYGKSRLRS